MTRPDHLLLVDADTVEAYAWARLLGQHGFRVSVAAEGAAAIARHAGDPAEAVIVVGMTADLPTLTATLRRRTPGVAVLAIVEPQQSGPADLILVKPVDANELVTQVRRLLGRPGAAASGISMKNVPEET